VALRLCLRDFFFFLLLKTDFFCFFVFFFFFVCGGPTGHRGDAARPAHLESVGHGAEMVLLHERFRARRSGDRARKPSCSVTPRGALGRRKKGI